MSAPSGVQTRYLHIIYQLAKAGAAVRSCQIAQKLGVTRTSAHNMVKTLAGLELIDKQHYGYVRLTQEGMLRGRDIHEQYTTLYGFFNRFLELAPSVASDCAYQLMGNFPELCVSRLIEKCSAISV